MGANSKMCDEVTAFTHVNFFSFILTKASLQMGTICRNHKMWVVCVRDYGIHAGCSIGKMCSWLLNPSYLLCGLYPDENSKELKTKK